MHFSDDYIQIKQIIITIKRIHLYLCLYKLGLLCLLDFEQAKEANLLRKI